MIGGFSELVLFIQDFLRGLGCRQPLEIKGHCEILFDKVPGDIKPCPGRHWLNVIHSQDWLNPKPIAHAWWEQNPEWIMSINRGITDGTRPAEPATRAESAVMALRASRLERVA